MITQQQAHTFASFCISKFNLSSYEKPVEYSSLPFAIIDCVYSSQAKYDQHVKPVLENCAAHVFGHYGTAAVYLDHTLTGFMKDIDDNGGVVDFVDNIIKNHQKLSGRLKLEVCYDLASKLNELGINTMSDFKTYQGKDFATLEKTILSVRGMGTALTPYLFMLAGDSNFCKPDTHLHKCVKDALGINLSDSDCQQLFTNATNIIKSTYPDITVKDLDFIVWDVYRPQKHT